ncbi:hypothetical protein IMZ48_22790 [Candidatus Bathyarchaeota archaeon]|nr:hypothetical protein [Candidatus Bathyarchaeota archaeon]
MELSTGYITGEPQRPNSLSKTPTEPPMFPTKIPTPKPPNATIKAKAKLSETQHQREERPRVAQLARVSTVLGTRALQFLTLGLL